MSVDREDGLESKIFRLTDKPMVEVTLFLQILTRQASVKMPYDQRDQNFLYYNEGNMANNTVMSHLEWYFFKNFLNLEDKLFNLRGYIIVPYQKNVNIKVCFYGL